jgi:hypothetical protein
VVCRRAAGAKASAKRQEVQRASEQKIRDAFQNIHKSPRIGMVALQPSSSSYFQGVAILGHGAFASFLSGVAALQASISTGWPLIAIRAFGIGELPNWPA